ncbi:hypothetical protein DMN91_012619 [Ooceraea biroi]|uniref:Uncharacterized protein n=1 Tax=Ooceraea biroi TaxID=2015173 RepID=A0A026WZ06_OOCBI|nr:hypothetical protein X777_11997 [Ooceraea biroi]RLU14732.1 hypothetical protein DMN91_012619 [Ooceraea biroi]
MGSLVVVIAVIVYCSEVYCDTLPANIVKLEATRLIEKNDSYASDKGIIWKSLGLPRAKPTRSEEPKIPDSAVVEANKRKSRFLGTLAFLAGLSFGGLATAASSTVRNSAKLPQASLSLNLGPSKTSPYLATYYHPYPLLPYPLFYPGSLGLVPMTDSTKPQTNNDLTPQVISVFDNREPSNLVENNEEYADEEKKSSNSNIRRTSNERNGADGYMELRDEADRNAEEKTTIRGCKGSQRKHGSFSKGSAREREDLQVDDLLRATLSFRAANMTADANQTVTENTTMPMTTIPSRGYIPNENHHHHHHHYGYNSTTRPPFPGYFGGYPQNVNHVDFTTGSDAYQYHNYGPINHNLPYEQPANFYHNDKYSVYSNPHGNTHFVGPFPANHANEFVSPDQLDRQYQPPYQPYQRPEYQPPYADGFRPVK